LRIFKNRDLKDLVIVDNAVYSFGAQLSNGIPITPFKEDKEDQEFLFLMNYLENIKDLEDMRVANKQAFKMDHIYKFNNENYIAEYDYDLCNNSSEDEYSESEEEHHSQFLHKQKSNPFQTATEEIKETDEGTTKSGSSKPSQMSLSSNRPSKLPKSINHILESFSQKMQKTKSFHSKLSSNKLVQKQPDAAKS
jgi:hypothetical protein